eukprot:333733_1
MNSKPCRYYARPGGCWYKSQCRYSHDIVKHSALGTLLTVIQQIQKTQHVILKKLQQMEMNQQTIHKRINHKYTREIANIGSSFAVSPTPLNHIHHDRVCGHYVLWSHAIIFYDTTYGLSRVEDCC